MRRITKISLVIGGLILGLGAFFGISQAAPIPAVSQPLADFVSDYPEVLLVASWLFMVVALIVGLILILMGLFKPSWLPSLKFNNRMGQLEISQRALESDLKYRLVNELALIDPQVEIKLRRNHKVNVRVSATTNSQVDQLNRLAEQAQVLVVDSLKRRLDLKQVRPKVRLTPSTHQQRVRVV